MEYLVQTPLYRRYKVTIDWTNYDNEVNNNSGESSHHASTQFIEDLGRNGPEVDSLIARQQTLMYNESKEYVIAPGENQRPLSLIYDEYAEELSFPNIYYGQPF